MSYRGALLSCLLCCSAGRSHADERLDLVNRIPDLRMLKEIESGQLPLSALRDPKRPILSLRYVWDEEEGKNDVRAAMHCLSDPKDFSGVWDAIFGMLIHATKEEPGSSTYREIVCKEDGIGWRCTGAYWECDEPIDVHLLFRRTPSGPVLDTFMELTGKSNRSFMARQRAFIRSQLKRPRPACQRVLAPASND